MYSRIFYTHGSLPRSVIASLLGITTPNTVAVHEAAQEGVGEGARQRGRANMSAQGGPEKYVTARGAGIMSAQEGPLIHVSERGPGLMREQVGRRLTFKKEGRSLYLTKNDRRYLLYRSRWVIF